MESLSKFFDPDLQQPDMAFLNKLFEFQQAYYSADAKINVLEALLLELCMATESLAAGLIDVERNPAVEVNSGHIDLNMIRDFLLTDHIATSFHYELKNIKGYHVLICSLFDDQRKERLFYLVRNTEPFTLKDYYKVKPALPILNGMLLHLNAVAEISRQNRKTAHLQALIASLDDIIIELDENALIKKVWVRDPTKLFMAPEFFMEKTMIEVMGTFANIFMECIEKLLLTGERQECIYPDFNPDKKAWYSAKFQKIDPTSKEGKTRLICVIEDITAKKIMSDQLQHQTLELIAAKNLAEQIARKRTEILSIMSHEIRTPLNGIIGICNLLHQGTYADPNIREYIDHLNFSSNHLLNLVNDILDLEKIENKKMVLMENEIRLVTFIGNIQKQFLSLAKAKGLDLRFYHDEHIPELVNVDDLRLGRILNNLIGNAIKFTESGHVSIYLTIIERTAEKVRLCFKVEDSGIGIPEHLHNLVFDKFHQVQQASHRQQQGTGLGLSITKGLVDLFKSEIVLKSKAEGGTTFEFEIDFKIIAISEKRFNAAREIIPIRLLPELRLLVVDDNPVNLLVAKRQLSCFGLNAEQAVNGSIALEILKEKEIDVILIDLHMPGMDGYELAGRVQLLYPNVKVIIFTADILEEVRARLWDMGIKYVLSKPFNPEEMHQLLMEVVSTDY
ncbi:ATP-binding protein [Pedobacter sp. PLR]|uniref:ATP-binding protein n=1 Tax=Pedobacter sp. PLR TaxID=2994465 RepID=UPI002247AAB3|nr:ATP-binding protein [Pedobacter sp. PLR]MCX2450266.1 ATP-binding protein [Pedobacter sp. PLR]